MAQGLEIEVPVMKTFEVSTAVLSIEQPATYFLDEHVIVPHTDSYYKVKIDEIGIEPSDKAVL